MKNLDLNVMGYNTLMKLNFKITPLDLQLFLSGCIVSLLSFFVIYIVEYSDVSFLTNGNITIFSMIKDTAYCIVIAVIEEYIFRYLFLKEWIKNLTSPINSRLVLLAFTSSLIFGFLHLKLDAFPIMQINIALSGMSMFYATFAFQSLSMAIGMHFSWNFIQGVIFPFHGSGSNLVSLLLVKGSNINMYPETSSYLIVTFFLEIFLIWFLSTFVFKRMLTKKSLDAKPQAGSTHNLG